MSVFIATDITGVKEIERIIKDLPDEVGNMVVDDANDYLVSVFQAYPPFTHITRKEAYPETGDGFFSDKQRRWFFANLREGNIPEPGAGNRTQYFRNAWQKVGEGKNSIVANETPYGPYLMGDTEQARLSKLAGWKTMSEIVTERLDRIKKIAEGSAKRALRKYNRGKS